MLKCRFAALAAPMPSCSVEPQASLDPGEEFGFEAEAGRREVENRLGPTRHGDRSAEGDARRPLGVDRAPRRDLPLGLGTNPSVDGDRAGHPLDRERRQRYRAGEPGAGGHISSRRCPEVEFDRGTVGDVGKEDARGGPAAREVNIADAHVGAEGGADGATFEQGAGPSRIGRAEVNVERHIRRDLIDARGRHLSQNSGAITFQRDNPRQQAPRQDGAWTRGEDGPPAHFTSVLEAHFSGVARVPYHLHDVAGCHVDAGVDDGPVADVRLRCPSRANSHLEMAGHRGGDCAPLDRTMAMADTHLGDGDPVGADGQVPEGPRSRC